MNSISLAIYPFAALGNITIFLITEMGKMFLFLSRASILIFYRPFRVFKIVSQIYFIGTKSLFVICLTATFTGMVLGLQGYYTLVQFGSEGLLGTAVALSLIRELGPVLAAIMVTARAGSSIAAEIGIMRITEQIDALKTMDINPIKFMVSPRIVAAIISLPLLTAIFDVVGIIGGYISGTLLLGINSAAYFSRVESSVLMQDVTGGFIKSIVFALLITTICCFQGYYTHTRQHGFGAEGVSSSTTSAVVLSCVLILVADYVLTSIL